MLKPLLMVLILATASFASTDDIVNYDVSGTVEFAAEVDLPGFDFKGTGGKLTGNATERSGELSGKLTVQVKDFDTAGNVPNLFNLRNKHMLKHIEADKYPEATLDISKYVRGSDSFEGTLTFHGATNPVQGKIKLDGDRFTASFTIDLTKYSMEQPSNAGATVSKTLPFEIKGELKKR